MKRSEWLAIVAGMARLWPSHPYPPAAVEGGWDLVRDLEAPAVDASVKFLAATGREFPPPPGVLRATVAQLADDVPEWGEVWGEVMGAVEKIGFYAELDPAGNLVKDEVPSPWSHPLIGTFVQQIGWEDFCTVPLKELRTFEAQCRNKYEALARRRREDGATAGLPTGGLARLEATRTRALGPARIGDLLPGFKEANDVSSE